MQKAIIAIVVVVVVGLVVWALMPADEPDPVPEPQPAEETQPAPPPPPEPRQDTTPAEQPQEPQPEPEPEVTLPPLPESDPFVRERLEPMDLPESWVEQGDYVRRLAVLAENATRGEYPRRQLSFLAPQGKFQVIERDDRIFVDPESYDRYDRHVEQLENVDPSRLAGLLETINPLVETALTEIGVEAPPGEVFETAMQEVLEVPVLEGDGSVELVQPNVMYEFADPQLESLSPLKKQVLRMGPENVQRLQTYLRRLAREMELDVEG